MGRLKTLGKKIGFVLFSFAVWLLVLQITKEGNVDADNIGTYGFPLVFLREFHGKGDYSELNLGYNVLNLIIDVGVVVAFSLVLMGLDRVYMKWKRREG